MIVATMISTTHRNSNSEPVLNGKLVEEAAQLASRSASLDTKKGQTETLPSQGNKVGLKNIKNKEASPDDCFDLDKNKKLLQKTVSSPAATRKSPTTPKKDKEKGIERSKSDTAAAVEAKAAAKAGSPKGTSAPGSPEKKATTGKPKPTKNVSRDFTLIYIAHPAVLKNPHKGSRSWDTVLFSTL